MNTLFAIVFATAFLCVSSQINLFQNVPAGFSFSADYQKFNPFAQGSGLISGTINYDTTKAAFQLVNQLSGRTATETYTFGPNPSSVSPLLTQCSPAVASLPKDSIYWKYPASWSSIASGQTSGGCITTSPCTVGSTISATTSGTTITYTLGRYDGGACGCAVQYICYPLPPCQACAGITVTGGSIQCGASVSAAVNCTGTGSQALITLNAGATTFSVNMPSAQIGYGPIGLMNTNNAVSGVSCPSAAFTCTPPGYGTGKFKENNCGSLGPQCEFSATSDMLYWPLWYNNAYYTAGVADSTVVSPTGGACLRYARSTSWAVSTSPPAMNFVVNLWATNAVPPVVCGWNTSTGDMYTVNAFRTPAAAFSLTPSCSSDYCWKPMDIVFVIEFSSLTTFQDVINYQNFLLNLPTYLHITPQEVNIGIVIYTPSGAVVDTPLIANTQQLASAVKTAGKFACCNAFTTLNAQCCSGTMPASALPDAIVLAGNTLASWPTRTYTSKNIVLLTQGGFYPATGAGAIGSALTTASNAIKAKAATTIPYASAILNFDSFYFGQDQTVVGVLDAVRSANDARNVGLATTTQLSTLGLASQFDTVQNRVWSRPTTSNIYDSFKTVVSDLCASNNGRACGSCCGDCSCGAICAPPLACKKLTCYNVSLTPFPIQSNTCCNYTIYQCPGYNASNRCSSVSCNFTNDQCSTVSIKCPAANNCYNYTCNPSTGTCDPVQRFSDPNACYTASCPSGNTVVYTAKVCPALACKTSTCINATGACNYTALPDIRTASNCCQDAFCNAAGTGYIYDFPAGCKTNTTDCQKAVCDVNCQCTRVAKCTVSTCSNVTCTNGVCNTPTCPTNPTDASGVVDKCRTYTGTCTPKAVFDSAFSSCIYNNKTCTPADPKCQYAYCNSTTGGCVTVSPCAAYLGGTDRCHPLIVGGCTTNPNGTYNCNYQVADNCPPVQDPCNTYSCISSTGFCNITAKCATNENGNKCRVLDTTRCSAGCFYKDVVCTPLANRCYNYTCQPTIGCPTSSQTTFWTGCGATGTDLCQKRVDSSCVLVANGTQSLCDYLPLNCTSTDICLNSTCQLSTGTCSTPAPWPNCSIYLNGNNRCFVRVNSTCVNRANCQYISTLNCTGQFWQSANCYTTTTNQTRCNVTDICPRYQNGNMCRNISQAFANGTCIYQDVQCAISSSPCINSTCLPNIGCTQFPICANTSKCNITTTCNGVCTYQPLPCPPPPDACSHYECSTATSTQGCDVVVDCPPFFRNTDGSFARCLAQSSCSPCTYRTVNCTQPADACQRTLCVNASGCGQPQTWCPLYNNSDRCTIRGNCSQGCSYTMKQCPNLADPCQINQCRSSDGTCIPSQICTLFGPLNGGSNKCYPRDNSTCVTGSCQYTVKSCAAVQSTLQPCQLAVCNSGTGNCDIVANPNFTTANCPPSNDTCLVIDVSGAQRGTCCSYVPKCPQGANQCNVSSCNAGVCKFTSTLCPPTDPLGNLCDISSGCNSTTGQCTYIRKQCLNNATYGNCYTGKCNNDTGACEYAIDAAKCGICAQPGVTLCPPKNCTAFECQPLTSTTYKCNPIGTVCDVTYGGNTCVNGTCNPSFNTCPGVGITVNDCQRVYGNPDLCFYWATNPLFPGCCQQLPVCNSQVDFNYKCMLKICNASTAGTCQLFDNTQNVCPTYKDNDLCQPFQQCNNATGACTYDNIGIACAANETRPCFQGLCNATTGRCYSSRLPGCNDTAICVKLNVRCPVDACEIQICNVSDPNGGCIVNYTRPCSPVDNCTTQRCDPTLGCVAVPYNLGLCNKTSPDNAPNFTKTDCIRVIANGSKLGCCETELVCPLFPPGGDPICTPLKACVDTGNSSTSSCSYGNPRELCPNDFYIDPITGAQDLCKPYAGCSYGCLYGGANCSTGNVTCQISQCDPATGQCKTTDLCQNDKCVSSHCDVNTGNCVVDFTLACTNNYCVTQECVLYGCVTLNQTTTAQCQNQTADLCLSAYTNSSSPGCCNYRPKCVATNVCSNATCDAATGKCTFSPVCPPKKCQNVVCLVDAFGTPSCNYTDKPCIPASKCEVVDPCVEDGQPYSCDRKPFCAPSNDTCWRIECVGGGNTPQCNNVTNKDCDDGNACTLDLCYNGTCRYETCPFTDKCKPQVCENGQCVIKDINCNDFNACTNDICVNGTCTHTAVNCNDNDACTDDSCNPTQGCKNEIRICDYNEYCLYYDGNKAPVDHQPCLAPNIAAQRNRNSSTSCDRYVCTNQTCRYYVEQCSKFFSNTVALAATIGTGVLIGIIIAAVICCGLAGGGAYAVYTKNPFEKEASVMNNPLYHGSKNEIQNPLHRGH